MERCPDQSGWGAYFSENMDGIGLAVPKTIYQKVVTGISTMGGIVGVIEKFGPRVTVRELALAGKTSEVLMVVGAGGAAWYTGGIIGSAAVATGRYLSCGNTMLDAISYARQHYPHASWLVRHFQAHPEIYTAGHPSRRSYAARMRMLA